MNEDEVLTTNPYYIDNNRLWIDRNDETFLAEISSFHSNCVRDIYMDEINKINEKINNGIESKLDMLFMKVNSLEKENKELRKINSNISTALYTLLGEIQKKEFYEKIGKC